MVSLSTFETGFSKIQGRDDLVGLSRGFIYADTPSVMATLLKVDHPATAELMQRFFANWQGKGMSKLY